MAFAGPDTTGDEFSGEAGGAEFHAVSRGDERGMRLV